ncbi:MAG TPA: hypothetical protein VHC40_00775 [Rhizomicrobium sp.]|nr:hypothetical protein [Rhizomicrobium sp.]
MGLPGSRKRVRQACLSHSAHFLLGLLLGGGVLASSALAQELPEVPQPLVPVPAPIQEFALTPALGVEEMFTDNVYVTQDDRKADLVSRLFGGGSLNVNTGPTFLQVNGTASYDLYATASDLDGWNLDFNGNGHYDLVPDFLSLQAEGAVTQGYLSTYGTPAVTRNDGGNQIRLINYDAGPRLATELGDMADLVLNARYAQVLFDDLNNTVSGLTNSSIYQGTGRLDTGTRLDWLQLVTSGEYLQDDHDFSFYDGLETVYVRVLPLIRLIGRGGYESIRDPSISDLNNPIWTVGVEYTPMANSLISVEWGRRFNRPIWNVNARVQITDSLYGTARFLETVEPLNVRLNRSLTDIFAQSESAPPFVATQVFTINQDLVNLTSFNKQANGQLVYTWGTQTVSVSADWLEQDFLQASAPVQNRQWSATGAYTRQIAFDLSATLSGYYAHTFSSPVSGKNEVYQVGLSASYLANSTITLNGGYVYQGQHQLFTGGQQIDENVVYVTATKSF